MNIKICKYVFTLKLYFTNVTNENSISQLKKKPITYQNKYFGNNPIH